MKKVISVLLVLTVMLGLIPVGVSAENTYNVIETGRESTEFVDDGGMGSLISNSLESQDTENDENIENAILDVEIDGTVAKVTFNNSVNCNIIVAIYDENTNAMLGSGMGSFSPNTEETEITIDTDAMPEYFLVKAYILDSDNNPLNSSFESVYYTQAHQKFLETTIYDFQEDEKVVNFDESIDNNFAVLDGKTIAFYETEYNNIPVSSDAENHCFIFENPDETLFGLKEGDAFYYEGKEGVVVTGKVESVEYKDNEVTIHTNEDTALDEIFSFVKIDTIADDESTLVDTSKSDEGVVFEGSYSTSTFALVDAGAGVKHSFSIDKEFGQADKGGQVKLKGTLSFGVNLDLQIELYSERFSIELSLKEDLAASFEVTGKISSTPINIATLTIPTGVPGVSIQTDVDFVVKFSCELTFEATQEATIAFKYDSDSGFKNTSTPSKTDTDIQVEGEFYIGLCLNPQVDVLCGIIEIGVEGELGIEVNVKTRNRVDDSTQKHDCLVCSEGAIYGVLKFSAEFKLELWKFELSQEIPIIDAKLHLFDFYISDELGFGKGKCLNSSYMITFNIIDTKGGAVEGAVVDQLVTDSRGKVSGFFKTGPQTVTIFRSGYQSGDFYFDVSQPATYTIILDRTNELKGELVQEYYGIVVDSGVLETNEKISWELYENGNLLINGVGSMGFESVDDSPWAENPNIKRVVFGDGITDIGAYAFMSCENLRVAVLQDSITEICIGAFFNCSALIEPDIPQSVVTIGEGAFSGCISFSTFYIPDSVRNIGEGVFALTGVSQFIVDKNNRYFSAKDGVLFNYAKTKLIAYPACKTNTFYNIPDTVTDISAYAFIYCSGLSTISIPKGVTNIGEYAFSFTGLITVDIPETVTNIGEGAFLSCEKLDSAFVGGGNIGKNAFYDCVTLKKVELYGGVSGIGAYAFAQCKSLGTVNIPSGVTSIDEYAFYWCDALKNLTISTGVTKIGKVAFGNCTSITAVNIPVSVTSIENSAFEGCSSITSIYIPGSVSTIGSGAFRNCFGLETLNIGEGVKNIGYDAFGLCTALKKVVLPYTIKSINNSFRECTKIEDVYISSLSDWCSINFENPQSNPLYYTKNLHVNGKLIEKLIIPDDVDTVSNYAFYNLNGAKEIVIPDSVKVIGEYAFYGCYRAELIDIPDGVQEIGRYAFGDCTNLKTISIPKKISALSDGVFLNCATITEVTIPENIVAIGVSAFNGCTMLKSVVIPDTVTNIDMGAFSNCASLTSIDIPYDIKNIEASTFSGCERLVSIVLPPNITSIGENAFSGCIWLNKIYIPVSVTDIGKRAFWSCIRMYAVYYGGTESQWKAISIGDENYQLDKVTYYYSATGMSEAAVESSFTPQTKSLASVGADYDSSIASTASVQTQPRSDEVVATNPFSNVTYNNLVPGEIYVLMVLKGSLIDYTVNTDYLLYITDAVADENGVAEFTYYCDSADKGFVIVIFGACNHSLGEWIVSVEPTYSESGLRVQLCDKCREVVCSEEIPPLEPTEATQEPSTEEPSTQEPSTEPADEEEYMLGDVYPDGKINIKDATIIQRHLISQLTLNNQQLTSADVNNDGTVDIEDVTTIQKYLIKLVDKLG